MVSWSFTFIQKISGVGGKLTRAVYLAPRLVFWKYLIACKFFNIIFKGNIKFKNFIHNFIRAGVAYIKASVNLLILKGGGKLSRAVYLAPRLVFWRWFVSSKFFNIIPKANIKF